MFICSYLFFQFSVVMCLVPDTTQEEAVSGGGPGGSIFFSSYVVSAGGPRLLTDFLTEVTLKSPDDAIHVTSTPILPLPHL